MENLNDNNIALLIDMDNVSAKYIKCIFDELKSFGSVSIRRIYGNWKKSNGWNEELLLEYSIQPIQQFDYTKGKNATDMAMVIDAMDILYSNNVNAFCIVTSDSDFTKLAMRLRESKMYVIGMGESKTPMALTKACSKFVHLDLIASDEVASPKGKENEIMASVTSLDEISEAIKDMLSDAESVNLSEIGFVLGNLFSDFDVRNYGYSKLSTFVRESFPKLEVFDVGESVFVRRRKGIDLDQVQNEIVEILKREGGFANNLSKVHDILKVKHKGFRLKDYGFSRFSSLLKSMDSVVVEENSVRLKEK